MIVIGAHEADDIMAAPYEGGSRRAADRARGAENANAPSQLRSSNVRVALTFRPFPSDQKATAEAEAKPVIPGHAVRQRCDTRHLDRLRVDDLQCWPS